MRVRFRSSVFVGLMILAVLSASAHATDYTYTWTGTTNGNWSVGSNWGGTAPVSRPENNLVFGTGDYDPIPVNNFASPFDLCKLTITSAAPALQLAGNQLRFTPNSSTGGIYQNSANTVTIGNQLSWSGTNALNLNAKGAGGLILTGGLTSSTSGGSVTVGAGSVVFSTGTFDAVNSWSMRVGDNAPAALTIQDDATVTVRGTLELNHANTVGSTPATLTLKSGSLTVTTGNDTVIGRASWQGDPSTISAAFYQSGGTATLGGLMTIGYDGTATSLYEINAGTLNANAGMVVGDGASGRAGNGLVNIRGSGVVNVSGGAGLVIGKDSSLATSGRLNLSSGSLTIGTSTVSADLTLGSSGGLATLNRCGGTMTVHGNLVVGGASTLVLDATTANVATNFYTLSRQSSGTLVVVPYTNNLATTEAVHFNTAPSLTYGILGAWAVRQTSGIDSNGDYLATTGADNHLTTYSGYYNGLAGSDSTRVVSVTSSATLGANTSAYAVKIAGSTTTVNLSGKTLTLAGGGVILNDGAKISGSGGLALGNTQGLFYAGSSVPAATGGTVESSISGASGLTKFGPGTLVLAGNNSATLSGAVVVSAGTLNIQAGGALGAGTATVASGASLEFHQGTNPVGITVGNDVTINGTGVNGGGALRNVAGNNSTTPLSTLTLGSNAQINVAGGTLTLNGAIQGLNYNLTKTGSMLLVLAGSNGAAFPGSLTVAEGTLRLQHVNALGVGSAAVTMNGGTTLQLQNGINIANQSLSLTLSGTGTGGNGALENFSGNNAFAGAITLAADSQVNIDLAADTLTLSGAIDGEHVLTKAGSGTLVLSNTESSFTGTLNVLEGTLKLAAINNVGANGPLGTSPMPVVLGSSGKTATLRFTAASGATDRDFALAANSTGNFDVDTSLTLSGAISGNGHLNKLGAGTLTLSGTCIHTGMTIVSAGTLAVASNKSLSGTKGVLVMAGGTLAVTAGSNDQLPDNVNVTLSGGSFTYAGNGSVDGGEDVGALVLYPGHGQVTTTRQSSGYTPYLSFAALSHSRGGTVSFSATDSQIRFKTPPPLVNGIIGGYAFCGSDFAALSTTSPYSVQTYTGYVTNDSGESTSGTSNFVPGSTVSISSTSRHFNTLKLTNGIGVSMTGTNPSLTLNAGGLIANNSSGNNSNSTISGGTLKGSPSGELVLNVTNAARTLTVSSIIADNGGSTDLVKTGAGTLILSALNTYSGGTYVNGGTLYAGAIDSNGTYAGETVVTNGATLYAAHIRQASLTIGADSKVVINGGGSASGTSVIGSLSIAGFASGYPAGLGLNGVIEAADLGSTAPFVSGANLSGGQGPSAVPEPATWLLALGGVIGLAIWRCRRPRGV